MSERDVMAALDRSQAIIEFQPDGTIITANQNFLDAMGYRLDEIKEQHHRLFVTPHERESVEYRQFWQSLAAGELRAATYKRIGKGGREVWIQATYNPIRGRNGKVYKVVKLATDITAAKLRSFDFEGQIAAINKSQAVIEFTPEGTILGANENFLAAMGYRLEEIKGRHHSMFVEPAFKSSTEYRDFWQALARGEYQSAEYKRLAKNDREVWIQATYNPIIDDEGNVLKVVKFATDITAEMHVRLRRVELQKAIDSDLAEILTAVAQTNDQASSAASASDETSTNVQTVAAGTEELAASVSEISRRVNDALSISVEAVKQAEATNRIVSSLAQSAQKIGDVVDLISGIAAQTNLLALNATIEAARAGEAGKGFAVVASEVKSLASQTAKATEEISAQIAEVQDSTGGAVSAIELIGKTIGQVNEISSAIAAAVEEQSAVTHEMSANMQTASTGVAAINQAMNHIAASASQIDAATRKVKEASQSLA